MRHIVIALAGVSLAACGGGSKSAEDICNEMIAGDAEAAAEIRDDGIEPAALCACVGMTIEAKPEAARAGLLNVMKEVTAIRKADGVGVEDAAEKLQNLLEDSDTSFEFDESDWQATGRMLNDVGDQLEEGGACKAG